MGYDFVLGTKSLSLANVILAFCMFVDLTPANTFGLTNRWSPNESVWPYLKENSVVIALIQNTVMGF